MRTEIETSALVLRVQPLREADYIVTLLTSNHGRIAAVARSARKSKRRFTGGIDVFDSGTVTLESPRHGTELFSCNAFERRDYWLGIRKSLFKLSLASLAVEAIYLLSVDEDPHSEEYFSLLHTVLTTLNDTSSRSTAITSVLHFLLQTLLVAGFSPLSCGERFPPEVFASWQSMPQTPATAVKHSSELLTKSMVGLVSFLEEILEQKLKSRESVFTALRAVSR